MKFFLKLLRKVPPLVVLAIGLVAAVLSIIGSFPALSWCAAIAGALTIPVVITQYVSQGNVVVRFQVDDWVKVEDGVRFSAGRTHGKGSSPNVSVYMPTDEGGFEEVGCGIHTLQSGEVLVYAGMPFAGEVRIS